LRGSITSGGGIGEVGSGGVIGTGIVQIVCYLKLGETCSASSGGGSSEDWGWTVWMIISQGNGKRFSERIHVDP